MPYGRVHHLGNSALFPVSESEEESDGSAVRPYLNYYIISVSRLQSSSLTPELPHPIESGVPAP